MSSNNLDIVADPVDAFPCTACGKTVPVRGSVAFSPFRCPHCNAVQSVPLRLGNFLLLHLLGKGGMGAVFRALDTTLNRYVAIKVMQQSLGNDPKFVQDFLREARAAAQFNHPHVAQIYSFGEEKGQACLVMELMEGGSLDKLIGSGTPPDEVRVLDIALDVADALKAANKIGLRHGDIKPANIMFSKSGEAKVVDFGLAWYAESHQKPGEIWGTPYYIAPEKVESKPADHRADIYSFGGTFFHALTGHAPFEAQTAKEVVLKRMQEPAPDVRTLRPDIGAASAEVIARTLQREPSRRYPTYTSLVADLQKARDAAALRQQEAEAAARVASAPRGSPALMLGLLALLLAGAVGGFFVWKKNRDSAAAAEPRPIRHVLVDGRLIPVYSEEEEQSVRQTAAAEKAAALPGPDRPLTDKEAADLAKAVTQAASGEAIGATLALRRLQKDGPRSGAGAAMIELNMAISILLEGEADMAMKSLHALKEAHPADTPAAVLAGVLSGQTPFADIAPQIETWSAADRHFATFIAGLRLLVEGSRADAIRTLQAFVETSEASDGWVSAWVAAVPVWTKGIADWDAMQPKLADWSPAHARRKLRDFRRAAPWFLKDEVQSVMASRDAAPAEPPPPSPAPAAEDAARQEAARLDALQQGRGPRLAALDFEGALTELQRAGAELKTDAAQTRHARMLEEHQRMVDLKRYLVDRITVAPPPQPIPELRGTLAGADAAGVSVALRDGVTARRTWAEVGPALYAKLLDYYMRRDSGSAAERADRFLSLAVYAQAMEAAERAKAYLRMALSVDPTVQPKVKEWFPDVDLGAGATGG